MFCFRKWRWRSWGRKRGEYSEANYERLIGEWMKIKRGEEEEEEEEKENENGG